MAKRGRKQGVSDPTYENRAHAVLKKEKDERSLRGSISIHCSVQETLTHCADGWGNPVFPSPGAVGFI